MRNPDLTPRQRAELEALANMADEDIDLSDIPEIRQFSNPRRGVFAGSPNTRAVPRTAIQPSSAPGSERWPADTSERGFETRIISLLTNGAYLSSANEPAVHPIVERNSWTIGEPSDYDRVNCVDLFKLTAFLDTTQPETAAALSLDADNPTRHQFLARLKREVRNRGVIDVLRNGIKHQQHSITLFYGTPSPGNAQAAERYAQNRFSVTRQLRYSTDNQQLALDLVLFVNGLPIATFELKNNLTKQTVLQAVQQYRTSRSPREDLFQAGRCAVHFAVDEQEVQFCTRLSGKTSVFLPFNKGREDDGAGNPVNPDGLRTDYLWLDILTPEGLTNIIENYAQKVGDGHIWPRYHQLDVVRRLLQHAGAHGAGGRYLIQHSAGSGKSNSIAWLSRQLIGLTKDEETVFDSIIIVTDRIVLDKQINDTIQAFTQVRGTVAHAETSAQLRQYIAEGKKIIITTVQKFLVIHRAIGNEHRGRKFAIIIDEAHSSQGGRAAGSMAAALGTAADPDDDTFEDRINRIIESHRLLENAGYFAFTATPKNKTLELFGQPAPQEDGTVKHLPFHTYTMKQAIQEGFILDVLANHTTVDRYFNLVKSIENDPEFDSNRAQRKLRRYVESHEYAVRTKAEIMVDHFHESVFLPKKIQGRARAMVVTDGVDRAISYYRAVNAYIQEQGYPYRPIIAFSGDRDLNGQPVTEASLNNFPSRLIPARIQEDPYRILICADKFQTGYDEPLLHTMYVDKTLSGIRAVQTLSRLNRARPGKSDTFVLDFMNSADAIEAAFSDYYRTTILAEETDPNKLHDLKAELDNAQVYTHDQVDQLVANYLAGQDRDQLDPIADSCVEPYRELDEDHQVVFKGSAKAFVRLYAFLSQILPYGNHEWEKLSIFLNFLIPKLPAPKEDDLSIGILEAVDIDSYRAERQATQAIVLLDEDAEIDPVPAGSGSGRPEPELEPLSKILSDFNDRYGNRVSDQEQANRAIAGISEQVANDNAYRNAMLNSDAQNARIEHDAAILRLITSMVRTHTELYKLYTDDPGFRDWLNSEVFWLTYQQTAAASGSTPSP